MCKYTETQQYVLKELYFKLFAWQKHLILILMARYISLQTTKLGILHDLLILDLPNMQQIFSRLTKYQLFMLTLKIFKMYTERLNYQFSIKGNLKKMWWLILFAIGNMVITKLMNQSLHNLRCIIKLEKSMSRTQKNIVKFSSKKE